MAGAEVKARAKQTKERVAWPATMVLMKPIGWLKPFAANPRVHSAGQITQLARSITRFGWTVPVLVSEDGDIIAGHGRVLAAKHLGIEEVPVIIAAGWTEVQRREYIILDNRLAEVAEWDNPLLAAEIKRLENAGADVTALGFTARELEQVMAALNSGFLDDMAKGSESSGGKSREELHLAANGVQLTLTMLPADRNVVIAYLNSVRLTHGLGTISQALIRLAKDSSAKPVTTVVNSEVAA